MPADKANGKLSRRATLLAVWRYIRGYRRLVALTILLAACGVVPTLYVPVLIGRAVDLIVGPGRVYFAEVAGLLMQIGAATAIAAVVQWLAQMVNNKIAFNTVRDIRCDLFRHIQKLPLKMIDQTPHGDILNRVISDADQFSDGLLMGFTQLFTGVFTILCTLGFMLYIHPGMTALVVLLTPLSLFVASFIASRTYSMFRKQSETRAEQTAFINEMLGGQKVVQAFNRENETAERLDRINRRLEAASLRATFFSSITNPSTRFINGLVYAAVALAGAFAAIGGSLSVGGLAAFLSYANQYTKPFNEISGVVAELQNALACAARLFGLLDEQPQTPESADVQSTDNAAGHVELRGVSFSYSPERELIKDFNLVVKPGQRIAIVGPTGCGKTTLINLLMRFYDVNDGSIAVDGIDIRHMTRKSLRRSFGMVLQDTWLREGTIRDNLALGRPDATEQDIISAAKAAHAHEFIRRLPNGYDTLIEGDDGSMSQGQRQMLCVARVMLLLPPMLILDEATSSIDTRTEQLIQRSFAELMRGRTSFIVAHRLSTIREADVILAMRDGNVVEQGSHDELLRQGGFYAHLYGSQFAP